MAACSSDRSLIYEQADTEGKLWMGVRVPGEGVLDGGPGSSFQPRQSQKPLHKRLPGVTITTHVRGYQINKVSRFLLPHPPFTSARRCAWSCLPREVIQEEHYSCPAPALPPPHPPAVVLRHIQPLRIGSFRASVSARVSDGAHRPLFRGGCQ